MNPTRSRLSVWLFFLFAVIACTPPAQLTFPPVPELDGLAAAAPAAIGEAIEALRVNERDPVVNGRLAMQLDAHHHMEEAAILYARARYLDPDSFRWVYLQGRALKKLGQYDAAAAALRQALQLRPGHPGAQLELARLTQASGAPADAQLLYRELLERNPDFPQAQYAYGKFLLEQGDTESAVDRLQTALGLFTRYGQAHYLLALAHRELGLTEKAALHSRLFQRYAPYLPPPYDPLPAQVARLNRSGADPVQRAMSQVATGRPRQAAEQLEALVAQSPESMAPRVALIDVYGQLGDYEKAQQQVDVALSIDLDAVELHDNIGVLRLRQGRNADAVPAFRRAVSIDPQYPALHKNLGAALEAAGRLDEAVSSYRTAVELDPYDRQSVYLLARALVDRKQPAEAIALLQPLTAFVHRDTARYFQLLGRAHTDNGDMAAAAAALRQAMALANRYGLDDVRAEAAARLDYVRRRAE